MTDRIKGLVVALERDVREDDVEVIVSAIRLLKGIAGVRRVGADTTDWMNRSQIREKFRADILALWEKLGQ